MPGKASSQRHVTEQIDELRRKLQLLEGERQSYYEQTEYEMKQNTERITELRTENKEMRKSNAKKLQADQEVVDNGLQECPDDRKALRNKPGREALIIMDDKYQDKRKILHLKRLETDRKQQKLDSLKKQQQEEERKQQKGKGEGGGTGEGKEGSDKAKEKNRDDAHDTRNLENRLEKSELKCKEADHIRRTYQQIKSRMEDDQKTFGNTLDDLENEVQRLKSQREGLKVVREEAERKRTNAKEELSKLEAELQKERRRRDVEITALRREAEERRVQQEIKQKRNAARQSEAQDQTSEQKQINSSIDDEQEKIQTYEEAFKRIKEATGVSDTRVVVSRFENQTATQIQLQKLMDDNEIMIEELKDDKKELDAEFEKIRKTGENELSRGEKQLEDEEERAAAEDKRRDEALEELEKSSKILRDVKSGVEHLSEKLRPTKGDTARRRTKVSPHSDEYVLDELSMCEEELLKLLNYLETQGKQDITEISRKMDDDEFYNTVEMRLPVYNTRVKLPTSAKETMFDDEDLSGDDGDVMTRQALKKQSQQIIDSKTRKRPNKKKKRMTK